MVLWIELQLSNVMVKGLILHRQSMSTEAVQVGGLLCEHKRECTLGEAGTRVKCLCLIPHRN